MGHDAEFDLRIVGGEKNFAFFGDEGSSDGAAELGAYRDILQIRIAGAEAAGGGDGLRHVRVQAAGIGMNQGGERIDVSGFELGDFAVLDDFCRQRVLRREVGKDVGSGGANFSLSAPEGALQVELVEKNLGEL